MLHYPEICPVCGKGKHFDESYKKDKKILRCLLCDVEFFWPLEKTGYDFYQNSEYYLLGEMQDTGGWYTPFLNDPPPGEKLLDVGCGNGTFLSEAKRIYKRVYGVDFNMKLLIGYPSQPSHKVECEISKKFS